MNIHTPSRKKASRFAKVYNVWLLMKSHEKMAEEATPEDIRKSNNDLRDKLWPPVKLSGLKEWRKGQKDEREMVGDIVAVLRGLGITGKDFE